MLLKWFGFFVVLLAVVAAVFVLVQFHSRPAKAIHQPIHFNHSLHTQEWELECDTCHRSVREAEYAGRPAVEICAVCHEDPQGETAEEAALVEYIRNGQSVPWRRLYRIPDHVFYSHRRHVTVAQLECVECHGDIGISTSPPTQPLNDLTMEFCIGCHEKRDASTDCIACHR